MEPSKRTDSPYGWAGLIAFLLVVCVGAAGQGRRETVSAVAFGTSTQLGHTVSINLIIESYSTPEDQKLLLDAFTRGGNEGLVEALGKMPAKGRINTPRTLGYDIKYIRVWSTPTGRKLRLVTDRTIAIGEVMRSTRSKDYSVSVVELELSNDKDKSAGTLLPACKLKMTKQNEIEVEAFQNPWRLGNIMEWDK